MEEELTIGAKQGNVKQLPVERKLLKALLEAAMATSQSHAGKQTELYSLGALEATANFVYIVAAQSGEDSDLEQLCQSYAKAALERFESVLKD